nr:RES family NAD+ phosphorylase [Ectothiorhodospira variabilis]
MPRPPLRFPWECHWTAPVPTCYSAGSLFYRVQDAEFDDPLHFGRDPEGDHRWNPSQDARPQYGVLYAGTTPEAAIVETLLHDEGGGVIGLSDLKQRSLWTFSTGKPLCLVDLAGPALKRLSHDGKLLVTDQLDYPRAWSHALHESLPGVHGLLFPARPAPEYRSVALFERSADRVGCPSSHVVSRIRLLDWLDPRTGRNIIDWLWDFGVTVHDDGVGLW